MFLEGFFGESTEGKVHKNRIRSHFLHFLFQGGERKGEIGRMEKEGPSYTVHPRYNKPVSHTVQ